MSNAKRLGRVFVVVAAAVLFGPATARADGVVTGGQFAASVEHGQPVGEGTELTTALSTANRVFYFIRLNNPHGEEVTFTVQWSVNGQARPPMTIRTRGRTNWVFQPIRSSTRQVSIVVRDESGTQIHSDQLTIRP